MKDARVGLLLTVSILVMAVAPMLTAYFMLVHALRTSLDLGFNPRIVQTLEDSSRDLRDLARLDPARATQYRERFERLEELKQVYAEPEFLKQRLEGSLKLYFGLGMGLAVLLSVALATLLSRQIARSHTRNVAELTRQRDRVRYLEEMASWQELARMLAHEIKNPLTPIEMLVSSLSRAYLAQPGDQFQSQLQETQRRIGEELQQLKSTVNRFSEFARLPQVQLAEIDLAEYLRRQLAMLIDPVSATFEVHAPERLRARIDATAFRQVLKNLIRNGIEANEGRAVNFTIALRDLGTTLEVQIGNDGVPVREDIAPRMFDPYISAKAGKDNMGIGLAIVKKLVLEHGGEIHHEQRDSHPVFIITLPAMRT